MIAFVRKYPLIVFFILAYGFTWARWMPEAAAGRGLIDFQTPFALELLAGYGPALAAFLLTALISGRSGLKDLGSRLVRWRVAPVWYMVVLVLPVLIQLVGCAFFILFKGTTIDLAVHPPHWSNLAYLPLFIFGFDGLGEEVGWRGFALPAMLKNKTAAMASLILGILWGFWHLGYWLRPGNFLTNTDLTLGVTNTIVLAFIHTWIFTHARQSILIAILYHAINNTTSILLTGLLPFYVQAGWSINAVHWLLILFLLLFAKPYRLMERITGSKRPVAAEPIG